jgi:hypothetical protein
MKIKDNALVNVTHSRAHVTILAQKSIKPSSLGSVPNKHKRFIPCPNHANRKLSPNSLRIGGHRVQSSRSVKLKTYDDLSQKAHRDITPT